MKTAGQLLAESLRENQPLDPDALQAAFQAVTPPGLRVSVAGSTIPATCTVQADDRAVGGHSITCHLCGLTSHHPDDVANFYCGHCHHFHRNIPWTETN